MDSCAICKKNIENTEDAAILAMGGFGNPRYMCDECGADFDELTLSRDVVSIKAAADRISKKMSESGVDDKLTLKTVEEIMKSSGERKERIESGEHDFSEEEAEQNAVCDDELPPELRESEEDAEAERIRAEKYAKFDTITNVICIVLLVAAIGFAIYRIIFA